MNLRKLAGSTALMWIALFAGAFAYGWLALMMGMDTTLEIGFTLGAVLLGAVVVLVYNFAKSTSIGRKIQG